MICKDKITNHGDFSTWEGAHPDIQVNVLDDLPHDRYVAALKRVRAAIAEGRPLESYDEDQPGYKETSCSWGLCHESKETWPDAQDHTFPLEFIKHGRISHLNADEDHPCPMSRQKVSMGCFYQCRVFSPRRGDTRVTVERALKLYDDLIAEHDQP